MAIEFKKVRAIRILPGPSCSAPVKDGTVLLQFTIGFDGHPTAVRILESSGYPPFDKAAADGIQTWKAYPQFAGKWARIPVTFTLKR